jgi:hypothetical protein
VAVAISASSSSSQEQLGKCSNVRAFWNVPTSAVRHMYIGRRAAACVEVVGDRDVEPAMLETASSS